MTCCIRMLQTAKIICLIANYLKCLFPLWGLHGLLITLHYSSSLIRWVKNSYTKKALFITSFLIVVLIYIYSLILVLLCLKKWPKDIGGENMLKNILKWLIWVLCKQHILFLPNNFEVYFLHLAVMPEHISFHSTDPLALISWGLWKNS